MRGLVMWATAVASSFALLATASAHDSARATSTPAAAVEPPPSPSSGATVASSTEVQTEIKVLQRRITSLENKIAYYKRVTEHFVTGRERIIAQLQRWRSRLIDALPHSSARFRLRRHERIVEYGELIRGQKDRIHAKLQFRASQERALEAEIREITAQIRRLQAAA
jgi:chromosome segregation ATPase